MSKYFQFKKFKVFHDKSSMKVGTDAVLLGAYLSLENVENILEIGMGSGLISLIAAQKSGANIMAIDIHENSVIQAQENFSLSPWAKRLKAEFISIQDFSKTKQIKYDCIFSNPPFFENDLKSDNKDRNIARHNDYLSPLELILSAKILLKTKGILSIILPKTEGEQFIKLALENGYYLKRKILIYPKTSKSANRIIFDLCFYPVETVIESLVIRKENNDYSQEYRDLTKDFYLAF
jgi:tRNA1Val (adenine37-N6)-methyltransferase